MLEEHLKAECKKDISVYAIINNGFFKGRQNCVALEILENWCLRSGLNFGQGMCPGAGVINPNFPRFAWRFYG